VRILYGVNGEGMGHATRSQVVIESLLAAGHDVHVVASQAAYRYLSPLLPKVDEILGPKFVLEDGQVRQLATVELNVRTLVAGAPRQLQGWLGRMREWRPEVAVTDFEPFTAMYARASRTPMLAVDNINMLDRCRHDDAIVAGSKESFMLARSVTRQMVPNAFLYLVTTFFYPPLLKNQTVLVPPILRQAIVDAEPERGDHLLVYSSGAEGEVAALKHSGLECRVYGMRGGPDEGTRDGNIEFKPRSNEGFVEDLRTARAVITGGGFSLMSEAVFLGKPMIALPLQGQAEQLMNSRYLEREGFGIAASELTPAEIDRFMSGIDRFEERLSEYAQDGNETTLAAVAQRVEAAATASRRDLRRARRLTRDRHMGGKSAGPDQEAEK
jgi:uncharacterized protein (TIGR00661 family)